MAQQALWPELAAITRLGFALYGGTAIALRLGHRVSVDFDFFHDRSLDKDSLYRQVPF
ncbi:MAG: nucleotidyl transferase AbiEii/AbiGii toxin family protein [Asticcacaulis sp.]